ncbi:MAG: OmpH family outer membrane protein [Candidatus Methylomirabilia bacterium]
MTRVGVRTALLGVTAAVLLVGPTASAQSPGRIGYFDVQRILARSSAGVAAREQMEREKVAMQRQIDVKRSEIEKRRQELAKKGPLLSAGARKEKQETLERKIRDLRRLVSDSQRELEKKERELLQQIRADLSGVIQRFGKERGYLLILEKRSAGVAYGAPAADLTDEIIKAYDRTMSRAKR